MKRIKGLKLNVETVRRLTESDLAIVAGGTNQTNIAAYCVPQRPTTYTQKVNTCPSDTGGPALTTTVIQPPKISGLYC